MAWWKFHFIISLIHDVKSMILLTWFEKFFDNSVKFLKDFHEKRFMSWSKSKQIFEQNLQNCKNYNLYFIIWLWNIQNRFHRSSLFDLIIFQTKTLRRLFLTDHVLVKQWNYWMTMIDLSRFYNFTFCSSSITDMLNIAIFTPTSTVAKHGLL